LTSRIATGASASIRRIGGITCSTSSPPGGSIGRAFSQVESSNPGWHQSAMSRRAS